MVSRHQDGKNARRHASTVGGVSRRRISRCGGIVRACNGLACLFGRFEDIAGAVGSCSAQTNAGRTAEVDQRDAGQGALVCRRRPGRDARGAGGRARSGRGAGAGAVRRDQPRHRAAGPCRPGAGERARAHARAVHGRRVSVPGEVRLCHGRAGRGRPGRAADRTVFALHPHQSRLHACRPTPWFPCPATSRRRAPCSPPTWRPRSMRSGTARPARPTASPSSAAAWWGCWSPICARGCRARDVTVVDIVPVARRARARARRPLRGARRGAGRLRSRLPCQRHRRRARDRAAARRRGGDGRGAELVRRAATSRRRSARRSTAAGCRLVSSQVGKVAPSHRPRWTHGRRLAAALALLADPALDALLAPAVAFEDLPATAAAIFGPEPAPSAS